MIYNSSNALDPSLNTACSEETVPKNVSQKKSFPKNGLISRNMPSYYSNVEQTFVNQKFNRNCNLVANIEGPKFHAIPLEKDLIGKVNYR